MLKFSKRRIVKKSNTNYDLYLDFMNDYDDPEIFMILTRGVLWEIILRYHKHILDFSDNDNEKEYNRHFLKKIFNETIEIMRNYSDIIDLEILEMEGDEDNPYFTKYEGKIEYIENGRKRHIEFKNNNLDEIKETIDNWIRDFLETHEIPAKFKDETKHPYRHFLKHNLIEEILKDN